MLVSTLLYLALAAPDPWPAVYAAAGLTPETARVDLGRMRLYGGDRHRLPLFDTLMETPHDVPVIGEVFGRQAVAAAGSVAGGLQVAGALSGQGVRRGLIQPIPARIRAGLDRTDPFGVALQELRAQAGAVVGTTYNDTAADRLPAPLREELAVLAVALRDALIWVDRAFAEAPAAGRARHVQDLLEAARSDAAERSPVDQMAAEARFDRLLDTVDLGALVAGATDLCLVLDQVRVRLADLPPLVLPEPVVLSTPLGDLMVAGVGDDLHLGPAPMLLIDLGGNDTYTTGAVAAAVDRPVSVVLDLAGNDTYRADGVGGQGAGIGGIGILVDVSGDDIYTAVEAAQGCGIGGVGVLWDGGGNDRYSARYQAQGSAACGLGVLADADGRDHYLVVQRGQGYGYCRGAGVLVDAGAGDDRYEADDANLLFPSPQTKEHNASLSQGFGYGRRADYTDGRSLAGGVGLLVDGGGDDHYSCGVFGQGSAYWYGVGLLCDLAGDDRYDGVWYVQGAAAHFAVGGLVDLSGNDRYTATINMSHGAGHDFSLGYLYDAAGNDQYTAASLSLGAGNANGVGIFWDVAGDDVYAPSRVPSLGQARNPSPPAGTGPSLRTLTRCLGLFLDGGGTDTYPRPETGDGKTWLDRQPGSAALGVGVDLG